MKKKLLLAALALAAASTVSAQDNYASWTQNRNIVLNTSATGANVAGNVTNFPVLIRLVAAESTIFAQAKAGGADIRFSKAGGAHLPYQIERWDATAKRAEIWVRVDTVLGNNSTQTIKMYWGNSAAVDSSRGSAVFDTAVGFQTVYHMNDPNDSTAKDATVNGYFATPGNTSGNNPATVAAAIGNGKSLNNNLGSNASGAYYSIVGTNTAAPKLNFNSNGDFYTLSAWVRANSLPNSTGSAPRMGVIMKYGTASNQQYGMLAVGNNADPLSRWSGNHKAAEGEAWNEAAAVAGEWQHVVVVRAGAGVGTTQGGTGLIYVNGVVSDLTPTGNGTATNTGTGGDIVIGAYSNLQRFLDGSVDEITISNTARSADFIKLSYESQKLTQTFSNIGLTPAAVPNAPTGVTGVAGPANSAQVTVSWFAPAFNGGSTITGYTVTSAPGAKTCSAVPPTLTCDVTGLTPSTAYTFTVTATNAIGTGAASAPSPSVTSPVPVKSASSSFHVTGRETQYAFQLSPEAMAATDKLTLSIVDAWGRMVWSKSLNPSESHVREISWNGKAANGLAASAGVYVVRLTSVKGGKVTNFTENSVTLKP